MKISDVMKLKRGDIVFFPADRGELAGTGTVEYVGSDKNKNLAGESYIWVTVKGRTHSSVWPSNRLGGI